MSIYNRTRGLRESEVPFEVQGWLNPLIISRGANGHCGTALGFSMRTEEYGGVMDLGEAERLAFFLLAEIEAAREKIIEKRMDSEAQSAAIFSALRAERERAKEPKP